MKRLLIFVLCITMCFTFAACGSSYTAQDLQDAKERYASGKYTREDERMVTGFYEWKAEQDKYID